VNDQLEFKVHGNKGFKPDEVTLTKKLVDYLRLDTPLESLYKQWAKSDKHFQKTVGNDKFLGVRMLNQRPRENLFSFICSSNNNISRLQLKRSKIDIVKFIFISFLELAAW
jgi:N-glycosylase/DNA lyase